MRGDGVDGRVDLVVREHAAEPRAGLDERAERPRRQADALDQLQRPFARARVQQPGRRGVRALVGQLAAQPVGEQVGHERDRRGVADAIVGQQLVDGVDRHVLDAGDARSRRHRSAPVGALVAVVEGETDHAPALVEQRVVHAPGADADAGERAPAQRADGLGEEVQQVPAQPVRQPHGPVREAVALLELRSAAPSKRPQTTRPLDAPRSMAAKLSQGGTPLRAARSAARARTAAPSRPASVRSRRSPPSHAGRPRSPAVST